MLTSGNQYLRPEYLSPLPTTLDAKKSPLALLAQTCSNIGADNPNNKPIIPGLEKAKDQDKNKDKSPSSSSSTSSMSSMGSEDKSSFKPYDKKTEDRDSNNANSSLPSNEGKKTPSSKSGSPAVGIHSPAPATLNPNQCGKSSPNGSDSGHGSKSDSVPSSSDSLGVTSTSLGNGGSQNTLSGLGYGSSLGLMDHGASKDGLVSHLSLGAAYKHLGSLANCAGCSPVPGHVPVDAASTPHSFPSSRSSPGPLKPGFSVTSALSPYVGYARVKTASGGTTLVPVCRDPYCTNCQFSMQSAQLSGCPSGCAQCGHDRLAPLGPPPGSALHALGPSLIPGLGGVPSLYPHSMLPRPNVCSWMVGDTYCGKRFTTSEELLQHLRTHTNLSSADTSSLMSPALSVPSTSVAAWNAACHMHYTTAASLNSQAAAAGLRRAYPTSLSPVSSLGRYHPYKPPTLPAFQGSPMPPLPHPGLGLYYSPYGLYGQRLGPPVHQ